MCSLQSEGRETLLVYICAAEYLKVEVKGRYPDLIHLPPPALSDSFLFTDPCGIAFPKGDTVWRHKINSRIDQIDRSGLFQYWYELAIMNSIASVRQTSRPKAKAVLKDVDYYATHGLQIQMRHFTGVYLTHTIALACSLMVLVSEIRWMARKSSNIVRAVEKSRRRRFLRTNRVVPKSRHKKPNRVLIAFE